MRRAVVIAAIWLGATTAATGVGFTATHIVGDVVRGSGPVGDAYNPRSTQPAHTRDPGPETTLQREFDYPAGNIVVECTGRVARLLTVRRSPGWRITDQERGPDEDVDVALSRRAETLEVEVYCNEGVPRAVAGGATSHLPDLTVGPARGVSR